MKSLFWRYLSFTLALVLTSFCVFGASFIMRAYGYTLKELQSMLEEDAVKLDDLTSMLMENSQNIIVQRMFLSGLQAIVSNSEENVLICDSNGELLYYADKGGLAIGYTPKLPEAMLDTVFSEDVYEGMGDMDGLFDTEYYTCGRVINNRARQAIGAVFVSAPVTSARTMLHEYERIFIIIGLLVLSLTIVLSYFLAQNLSKPIETISKAAKKFAQGDFDVRVPEGRQDEIGSLSKNFNTMCEAVSELEEMRSSFIANVSHELKTPMTTIAGFADGILDGTIPPEKEKEYLTIISNDTRRLSRLVVRMLEASRISSGEVKLHKTVFNICETIRLSLVQRETRINDKKLDVDVDFEEDDIYVLADEDNITQVVYNLTDNAIKYVDEGGRLGVKVMNDGQKVKIRVSNTGPGIPEENIPYVFDRFYKLDKSRGKDSTSAGLGLFIVKSILNLHDENITVESGEGLTTFTFTLPTAQHEHK